MYKIAIILTIITASFCFPQDGNRIAEKIRLENGFAATITDADTLALPSRDRYERCGKNLYRIDLGNYMLDEVRCVTYASFSDGVFGPLVDWARPTESTFTLLTTPLENCGIVLHVEHLKYNFASADYDFRLSSFLASCIRDGCIPYVGIETVTDEAVTASLFLVNGEKQFNHVLKLSIPKEVFTDHTGQITGTLHTYVPMGNVSDLYAK